MTKITCVIFGVIFLAMGILGVTGIMTIFRSDTVYVNVGEIIIGVLGVLIGVLGRGNNGVSWHEKQYSNQVKEFFELQRKDYERLWDINNQLREEYKIQTRDFIDLQKKDFEQLREENKQLREENKLQAREAFDLQKKDYDQKLDENSQLQEKNRKLLDENQNQIAEYLNLQRKENEQLKRENKVNDVGKQKIPFISRIKNTLGKLRHEDN